MAYVPVPKDLNAVKTKVAFNLTKRQLVCFGSGAALGLPLFFLTKNRIGTSAAAILMVMIMVPFMLLAMYEKNGRPFEKIVKNMLNVMFFRPKQRPYKTKNYYSMLMKQEKFDREVRQIVSGSHQSAAKANQGSESQRFGYKQKGTVRAGQHSVSAGVSGWDL